MKRYILLTAFFMLMVSSCLYAEEYRLIKKYRLVWNTSTKEIIVSGEFDDKKSVTYTSHAYLESDEIADIENKITSESLKAKKES